MLHSPEPWSWDGYNSQLLDANGKIILEVDYGGVIPAPPDMARLLLCVNALAGIPACDLPRVRKLWDDQERRLAEAFPLPPTTPAEIEERQE